MTQRPGFDEFVDARSAALLRTAYLLTHDWGLAEDLLQTASVRSWSAWSRLYDDPEPYVRTVLVRTWASWWRRRWRGEVPTDALPEAGTAGHESGVTERDLLWQALGQLPRRQRAVVVLRFYEDLPEAQVARLLGISVGTVKSQTSKTLLRIDDSLRPAPLERP